MACLMGATICFSFGLIFCFSFKAATTFYRFRKSSSFTFLRQRALQAARFILDIARSHRKPEYFAQSSKRSLMDPSDSLNEF
jgi:hypothetical protein